MSDPLATLFDQFLKKKAGLPQGGYAKTKVSYRRLRPECHRSCQAVLGQRGTPELFAPSTDKDTRAHEQLADVILKAYAEYEAETMPPAA